jgi:hypothetical protein
LRLGSLFVTTYDSQGYGGGILTHLHMGERKRGERETMREKWVVVRDTTGGGREKNLTSVLKGPGHCPFVLLVSVSI